MELRESSRLWRRRRSTGRTHLLCTARSSQWSRSPKSRAELRMAAIRISQNSVRRIAVACTDHTRDLRRCVSSSYAFAAGLVRGSVARAGNSRSCLGRFRIEFPPFLARFGVAMNVRNRELIPSFSRPPSRVMIRKVGRYEEDLLAIIHESLREFSLP